MNSRNFGFGKVSSNPLDLLPRIPGTQSGDLGSKPCVGGYLLNKISILNSFGTFKINLIETESQSFS